MMDWTVLGPGTFQENAWPLAYGQPEDRQVCTMERKTLLPNCLPPNFDFRFKRMHTRFHLGRAACSNSIPTHSLRYHSHLSSFSPLP